MMRNPISLLAGLALAIAGSALAAAARDVTGSMAYMERIALVPGAQLVVELRGPGGLAGEARIEADGRQVPLPFALTAPDASGYTLRGAIFVGGRPEWLSAPVAVPAGEGAVDLGVVPLTRAAIAGFVSRMDCGGTIVDIGFVAQSARLGTAGEVFDLQPREAASGTRFSDGATPETVFWSRGNAASVTVRGTELPECLPVIAPPLLPLTARGNEPGWRLDLSEAGYVLERDLGRQRSEGALPEAVSDRARPAL